MRSRRILFDQTGRGVNQELLTIRIRLLICSIDKAEEIGLDWWKYDRYLSPGREQEGIFEMPGGQSGNPLSPYYRAGFMAWARGEPLPFLPGATEHTLTLTP